MNILICGSMAYDNIMVFPGHFKEHILPEQMHILNVAFLVPELRREFGGCAGNIAYNVQLLGDSPLIMATVGQDAEPYLQRIRQLGMSLQHIRSVPDSFTAQAFITTDRDDNQITAFHPGAMNFSHHNRVADANNVVLGIVSPDGRDGMLQHAHDFAAAKIPFIFDPGQGLPMFSGEELKACLHLADYACFNDYEAQLACERSGQSLETMAETLQALIVTRGAAGSWIFTQGKRIDIPCVTAEQILDPTGCGDAYRAGLLHGIAHGWDWLRTGRLASVMGAVKIASRGGQNHAMTREEISRRFFSAFGSDPGLIRS